MAVNKMNNLLVIERNIRVALGGPVDMVSGQMASHPILDADETDRSGVPLTAASRAQLMARLAQSKGMHMPVPTPAAVMPTPAPMPVVAVPQPAAVPAVQGVPSRHFVLQNMFNPETYVVAMSRTEMGSETGEGLKDGGYRANTVEVFELEGAFWLTCFSASCAGGFFGCRENESEWDLDIRDEVLEECSKSGPVQHLFVDKQSQGHVYVKFRDVAGAMKSQGVMHGRFFAGQMITVRYLTESDYNAKFPEAASANTVLPVPE